MPALVLTADQLAVLNAFKAALEDAFASGVESPPATPILDPFTGYTSTVMTKNGDELKTKMKGIFESVLSAFIKIQPVPPVPVAGVVTINYMHNPTGTGTLTFTDGILTGHTETP